MIYAVDGKSVCSSMHLAHIAPHNSNPGNAPPCKVKISLSKYLHEKNENVIFSCKDLPLPTFNIYANGSKAILRVYLPVLLEIITFLYSDLFLDLMISQQTYEPLTD
jgi:hypothetical protein